MPNLPLGSPGTPPGILVVDDEELIAIGLRELLRAEGYEADSFTDPTAALESLKRNHYSVIISDQKMPGLSGLEFFEHARREQPDASRILVTGVLSLETVIDSINKGEIFRFIVKPWYREELLATVHNAVQRYELHCRNESLQGRTLAMNRELQAQVDHIGEQNDRLVRLNEVLQESLSRSVETCVHMLEVFLPVLGSQAHRVHQLCRIMGDVVGLSPADKKALEIAAWLHDIGLIGVPRSVIRHWQSNPTGLTTEEASLIHRHPLLGETLARFAQPLEMAGHAIRSHHERFDGLGYPDGLKADEIPWPARLLAVAVDYASRVLEPSAAAAAVRAHSGTAFDPEAVRVFMRALPKSDLPAS
jgi:response regulator RpfG family c-di-GMP phosphodiesterase